MIKLDPAPQFEKEVSIAIPGAEEPALVKVIFRTQPLKRVHAYAVVSRAVRTSWLAQKFEFIKLCWRLRTWANVIDMLDEMTAGWSADDFDVPYSKDALRKLLVEYPGSGSSLFYAYLEGLKEARIKN